MFFDALQEACDEKGIALSALLDSVGMSRGNINRWRTGETAKPATVIKLANALGVDRERLMPTDKKKPTLENEDGLTEKDRRDIACDLEKMMDDLEHSGDLMFDGDPASPEAIESIRNALAMGLEYAKKVNKEKYTPKKYRKNSEE